MAGDLGLIWQAVQVLRRRWRSGCYPELSVGAADNMMNNLTAIAVGHVPASDRSEATALARQILDDDHPERSELWSSLVG